MFLLDDLLAPIGKERFLSEYYRKKPLHLSAHTKRPIIFSFQKLNEILAQASLWNEKNLRMWIDCSAISPEQYSSLALTPNGHIQRPNTAKIEKWFRQGASLVLNHVDDLTPELREIANCLEIEFLGQVSANIYASSCERRAFNSHYDDHEVFCFHVAGEKKWRIYKGRLDNPVGQPAPRPNLQQLHDQAKGPVLTEIIMKPGDFLYLPRGQYHDALALNAASLHVTFSLVPVNGLAIFNILESAAVSDSLFRDDLPSANGETGKKELAEKLALLGERVRKMLCDPTIVDRVALAQAEGAGLRHEARIGESASDKAEISDEGRP